MPAEIEAAKFDTEYAKRRRCAGYASKIVRICRENGITASDAMDACELAIIMLHGIRSEEIRSEEIRQTEIASEALKS
jgi:hypothetical protein